MSIVPLVLRLLIAVALVFGGAGTAVAEVRMQLQHAGEGVADEIVEGARHMAVMADCHDDGDSSGSVAAPIAHGQNDSVITHVECCVDQACGCACAQPGSIAIAMAVPKPPMAPGSSTIPWPGEGYAPPLLVGLTRPPIA